MFWGMNNKVVDVNFLFWQRKPLLKKGEKFTALKNTKIYHGGKARGAKYERLKNFGEKISKEKRWCILLQLQNTKIYYKIEWN